MRDDINVNSLPRVRSHFDVIHHVDLMAANVVAIIDQDDGAVSVTNDVENVVKRLVSLGMLKPNARLIYRDSMGRWDEIVIQNDKFNGFLPIGVETWERAIEVLKARVEGD